MTQVFLLSDGTNMMRSFPDPGNWNPVNTVECIGGGAHGAGQIFQPLAGELGDVEPQAGTIGFGGAGGGGGAYAKGLNVNPVFPVSFCIIAGATGYAAYYTSFNTPNNTTPGNTPGQVSAQHGGDPSVSTGGPGGQVFYPSGNVGGKGGNSPNQVNGHPGGGGGAGGPNGAGSPGVNGTTTAPGAGGAANGGTVPGGAAGVSGVNNNAGSPGNTGTQFDATHGCGSGGGAAFSPLSPPVQGMGISGRGGLYGGGGAGRPASGDNTSGTNSGWGADGLIVLTYVPLAAAPKGANTIIMI